MYDNRKRRYVWLGKDCPPTSFPKPDLHPKRDMLTVWWFSKDLIQYRILQPGQTITAETYCCDLIVMFEKLRKMWPAVVNRKGPVLLQDNARPHSSKVTRQKLKELGIEVFLPFGVRQVIERKIQEKDVDITLFDEAIKHVEQAGSSQRSLCALSTKSAIP
ncbi:unnamed protein product [Nippostrongylus brasiliensis]|uniref:Mariner Mos1 transposase n=1 Tax=Nippostrongylus brasiliensis TaxID=27835 RepID=A0A0N4YZ63_NIPBR|nr:unnamed protein product [Nippostrongylus brasiliensis]